MAHAARSKNTAIRSTIHPGEVRQRPRGKISQAHGGVSPLNPVSHSQRQLSTIATSEGLGTCFADPRAAPRRSAVGGCRIDEFPGCSFKRHRRLHRCLYERSQLSLAGPIHTAAYERGLPQERQNMRWRAIMSYARVGLSHRRATRSG
jgi:hypothetical protein